MSAEIEAYCKRCKLPTTHKEIKEPSFSMLYCEECGCSEVTPKTLADTQREVSWLRKLIKT